MILILIIIIMGIEIVYLVIQNNKLRGIIEDPKKYFKTLSPDDMVPPFSAQDIFAGNISLNYTPGAPFSMLFWFSPTCTACEDNIGFWSEIFADTSFQEIRFLGMCAGTPEEAREFASENGLKFPIVGAQDPYLMETYKGNILPQTVLISPDGKIIRVWPGAVTERQRHEIIQVLSQLQP
nr:redoxin domain-containing protein [candidate division Zixibacteria bacterium]